MFPLIFQCTFNALCIFFISYKCKRRESFEKFSEYLVDVVHPPCNKPADTFATYLPTTNIPDLTK